MIILTEVGTEDHINKRKTQRFSEGKDVLIGYNDEKHRGGDFVFIGEGPIDNSAIEIINSKIGRLKDFNVNPKKSYAVKLADIKPNLNTIKFNDGFNKENVKYQMLYFIFRENGKNSGGNTAYIIIRNNIAETIMYSKNKEVTPSSIGVQTFYRDFDEFVETESIKTSLKQQIKEEIRNYILKQVLK